MTKKQISDIQSGIWMIGIAILFITGDWWPGILILAGVSMVVSNILKSRAENAPDLPSAAPAPVFTNAGESEINEPLPDPSPRAPVNQPLSAPIPAQPEAEPRRPVDRLPENCETCGAPVRGRDVTWTGFDTARCGFCGSPLKMKT